MGQVGKGSSPAWVPSPPSGPLRTLPRPVMHAWVQSPPLARQSPACHSDHRECALLSAVWCTPWPSCGRTFFHADSSCTLLGAVRLPSLLCFLLLKVFLPTLEKWGHPKGAWAPNPPITSQGACSPKPRHSVSDEQSCWVVSCVPASRVGNRSAGPCVKSPGGALAHCPAGPGQLTLGFLVSGSLRPQLQATHCSLLVERWDFCFVPPGILTLREESK